MKRYTIKTLVAFACLTLLPVVSAQAQTANPNGYPYPIGPGLPGSPGGSAHQGSGSQMPTFIVGPNGGTIVVPPRPGGLGGNGGNGGQPTPPPINPRTPVLSFQSSFTGITYLVGTNDETGTWTDPIELSDDWTLEFEGEHCDLFQGTSRFNTQTVGVGITYDITDDLRVSGRYAERGNFLDFMRRETDKVCALEFNFVF